MSRLRLARPPVPARTTSRGRRRRRVRRRRRRLPSRRARARRRSASGPDATSCTRPMKSPWTCPRRSGLSPRGPALSKISRACRLKKPRRGKRRRRARFVSRSRETPSRPSGRSRRAETLARESPRTSSARLFSWTRSRAKSHPGRSSRRPSRRSRSSRRASKGRRAGELPLLRREEETFSTTKTKSQISVNATRARSLPTRCERGAPPSRPPSNTRLSSSSPALWIRFSRGRRTSLMSADRRARTALRMSSRAVARSAAAARSPCATTSAATRTTRLESRLASGKTKPRNLWRTKRTRRE
mmetsp:Transcript_13525/g.57729  ORF Transcript_13525/g.57729 Transcript_13525/m.57729 type:complete len:301 (+) Transcript_13525:2053-2955(+)